HSTHTTPGRISDPPAGWQPAPQTPEILLQWRVVRCAHEGDRAVERNEILQPQLGPLRISVKRRPSCFSCRAVFIRKEVNQSVRIIEVLPNSHHVHAVLLEHLDLALAESLVQLIDSALELTNAVARLVYLVETYFEAARVLCGVPAELAFDVRA